MRRLRNLVILALLFAAPVANGQTAALPVAVYDSIPVLSAGEADLFRMLNELRVRSGLPALQLSPRLCRVAALHAADLLYYQPLEKGCTLQSWSNSGNWKSCCALKDMAGMACMKSKPKEITGYPGDGYELTYWSGEKATPAEVFSLWQQADASEDMLLSRDKWKQLKWKAAGVAMREGIALLWLGEKADPTKHVAEKPKAKPDKKETIETKPAKNTSVKAVAGDTAVKNKSGNNASPGIKLQAPAKQKTDSLKKATTGGIKPDSLGKAKTAKTAAPEKPKPVPPAKSDSLKKTAAVKVAPAKTETARDTTYYLISASVSTKDKALNELKKLKGKGFNKASVVADLAVYRIAVFSTGSQALARAKQIELKSQFPGIWIWKKY